MSSLQPETLDLLCTHEADPQLGCSELLLVHCRHHASHQSPHVSAINFGVNRSRGERSCKRCDEPSEGRGEESRKGVGLIDLFGGQATKVETLDDREHDSGGIYILEASSSRFPKQFALETFAGMSGGSCWPKTKVRSY